MRIADEHGSSAREPDPGQSTNRLMAHDFRRKTLIPSRF
jgi:hypothetical protein